MRMTGIVIDGPSDVALIDHVHLWTLKSVDNVPYFLRGYKNPFLECDMVIEQQLSTPMENSLVSNLSFRVWLMVWFAPVMQKMCDYSHEAKQPALS